MNNDTKYKGLIAARAKLKEKSKEERKLNKKHKIKTKSGKLLELELSRTLAIKIHCTECMGYEGNPMECDIKECALYPFRGKSLKAYD